jgi:hypothetical protein
MAINNVESEYINAKNIEEMKYLNKEEQKEKEILDTKIKVLREQYDFGSVLLVSCEDGTKIVKLSDANGLGKYIEIEEKASTYLLLNMKLDIATIEFKEFMDCGYEPTMEDLRRYAEEARLENEAYCEAQAEKNEKEDMKRVRTPEEIEELLEMCDELDRMCPEHTSEDTPFNNEIPEISPIEDTYINNDMPQISPVEDTVVKKVTKSSLVTIDYIDHIFLYPLKMIWNPLVIGLAIWAFIAWWALIFGSIIAIVLILIFSAYEILLLPVVIFGFISPFTPIDSTDEEKPVIHILGILWTAFIIYIIYYAIVN